jgi:hypothetical protein
MIINELDYLDNLAESIQIQGGLSIKIDNILDLDLEVLEKIEGLEGLEGLKKLKRSSTTGNYGASVDLSVSGNGSSASGHSSTFMSVS